MRFRFLVLSTCFLTASACTQPKTITILHTNDMHASFIPRPATWMRTDPKPMVGGFNELTYAVDSIRAVVPATLLLDAGDVMTGNPISDISYGGAEGGALFEMMNRIGYDASAPGNHDLDISQENLRALIRIAKFPALSANLVNNDGKFAVGNTDHTIIERDGLRIGIFGIMLQRLAGVVNQNNLVGIKVLSPVETAQRMINELKPRTDLVIALTHQGADEDSTLATQLTGLDVIIGGHSHTRIQRPKIVNNVVIAQAGANCENLGILELTVENDRVISHNGRLLQLWAREGRQSRLSPFIDSLKQEIDREYAEVIATLKGDWKRASGKETSIGNFIITAMADAAGAEIGFANSHGIRKDVAAGPLTKRDLYEVLPFRNVLVTFQLSGKHIRSIMSHYLNRKPAIEFTGIHCTWKRTQNGNIEIVSLQVNGRPVDDDRMYTCATSDFFAGQSQGYIGMEIGQPVFLNKTVFEAVEQAARKTGTITTTIENRIKEVQ